MAKLLGRGPQTDILSISLSGHDYINHAFGPESRLSHDHFLQLDRTLQAFFADLDRRIGKDHYVAVLTADHGFLETPEWAQSQGREAGRLNPGQTLSHLNAGLSTKFGDAKWTLGYSTAGILFDQKVIAAKGLTSAAVEAEAKTILLQIKGIANVFTRPQLAGTEPTTTPYLAVPAQVLAPGPFSTAVSVAVSGLDDERLSNGHHPRARPTLMTLRCLFFFTVRVGSGQDRSSNVSRWPISHRRCRNF